MLVSHFSLIALKNEFVLGLKKWINVFVQEFMQWKMKLIFSSYRTWYLHHKCSILTGLCALHVLQVRLLSHM